jgi:hypothetical protein
VDEALEVLASWAPGLHEALTGLGEGDHVTDLTSARAHGIVQACLTRQILVLADRAYQGAGATFRTPYYHHSEQPEHYQQFNCDHARLRAPGERAFARLKSWRIMRRARSSTRRISRTIQAIHVLLTCDYSG